VGVDNEVRLWWRNCKAEPSNMKICKLWFARGWFEYMHSPEYSAEVKESVELLHRLGLRSCCRVNCIFTAVGI